MRSLHFVAFSIQFVAHQMRLFVVRLHLVRIVGVQEGRIVRLLHVAHDRVRILVQLVVVDIVERILFVRLLVDLRVVLILLLDDALRGGTDHHALLVTVHTVRKTGVQYATLRSLRDLVRSSVLLHLLLFHVKLALAVLVQRYELMRTVDLDVLRTVALIAVYPLRDLPRILGAGLAELHALIRVRRVDPVHLLLLLLRIDQALQRRQPVLAQQTVRQVILAGRRYLDVRHVRIRSIRGAQQWLPIDVARSKAGVVQHANL